MTGIANYKTARGILNYMERILKTPWHQRSRRFWRGWAWDLTNGQERIREEFPEAIPDLVALLQEKAPKTPNDLTVVGP